jgi:glycosyltransferase involved in cell wall biosynthesis
MLQLKQTVCLNMIVRNECRIIERCLNSVRGFIDHWVIVDTGSTDGTQHLIQRCMRNVPGELIERPWVDFAHNRNEALEFARGKTDYVFVIDADEVLVLDQDSSQPRLTHDAYYLKIFSSPVAFWRIQLFRNAPGWRYESAIHEYLAPPETATEERLQGVWIDSRTDGSRAAEPGVYQRDVEQLLLAHQETPDDPRTVFNLAQSYAAAGEPVLALQYYQRRVEMGGWPEEAWCALLKVAEIKQLLQREWPEVLQAYLDAFQFRPTRAEPLYRIAVHYRWQGAFHLAHLFLQQAVAIPYPQRDYLAVEERLYRYLIRMALATCCYHLGQYEAGIRFCDELLGDRRLVPPNMYDQILINRHECATKAAEAYSHAGEHRQKIKVYIPFRNPGIHLDSCVERLLCQTCVPFEMVFLDIGSTDESHHKVPVEDPRVTLVRRSEDDAVGENVCLFAARHCDADDVVLLLDGSDWLASDTALTELQRYFADPGCLLTYGQFQYADGAPGLACAIPNIDSDRLLIEDWRCSFPLAFRGALLQQVVREDASFAVSQSSVQDQHSQGLTVGGHVALAKKLISAAGSAGVRYNPRAFYIYNSDRTHPTESIAAAPILSSPAVSKHPLPTISCLTITLNRLVLLKEAVRCYCRQTYPNRELIIVTDGTPQYRQAIDDYIRWLGRADIYPVYMAESGQPLGVLRNIALDVAKGTIVCQWDDDDLNHPERLERQFECMNSVGAEACCFTDQLQFFYRQRVLYWADWRGAGHHATEQLIPGTLMARREVCLRYPETGPLSTTGEDSVLLAQIAAERTVAPFSEAGYLNVYCYHGANAYPEVHHRRIATSAGQSADFLRHKKTILTDALQHYRLPGPYRVTTGNGLVVFEAGNQ